MCELGATNPLGGPSFTARRLRRWVNRLRTQVKHTQAGIARCVKYTGRATQATNGSPHLLVSQGFTFQVREGGCGSAGVGWERAEIVRGEARTGNYAGRGTPLRICAEAITV